MPLALIAIALLSGTPTAAPTAADEKPRLICRESETLTGSRIRTGRRCKTPAEWEKEDAELSRIPPSLRVTEGQNDGHPPPARPQ